MARLTAQQWKDVRDKWEHDPRFGYAWLIKELNLNTTRSAIQQRAENQEWQKVKKPVKRAVNKTEPLKIQKAKRISSKEAIKRVVENAPVTRDKHNRPKKAQAKVNALQPVMVQPLKGIDELTEKEKIFVGAYLSNGHDAAAAAIAAGFTKTRARAYGYELLHKPKVLVAIRTAIQEQCIKFGVDAEAGFQALLMAANFDANEFSSYVKYCCPSCWSSTGRPQLDRSAYYFRKDRWEDKEEARAENKKGYKIKPFPYEIWDKSKDPNPDCIECRGEGVGEVIIHDTRNLSPIGRLMYCGVKETRNGVEVVLMNKEKMFITLLTCLGLFKDKIDKSENAANLSEEHLNEIFNTLMGQAKERQRQVDLERGFITEGEVIENEWD